ncbi:hypothetical protein CROQUDRAFT_227404, partial [Cronartium quercuum f. sp. fusiforme G11]
GISLSKSARKLVSSLHSCQHTHLISIQLRKPSQLSSAKFNENKFGLGFMTKLNI